MTVFWHSWTMQSILCQIIHNSHSVSSSEAATQSSSLFTLMSARYLSHPAHSNHWFTSQSVSFTITFWCSASTSLTLSSMALTAWSHTDTMQSAVCGHTLSGCHTWKYCDPWHNGKNLWHATETHDTGPSAVPCHSCWCLVSCPFHPYCDAWWACHRCFWMDSSLQQT